MPPTYPPELIEAAEMEYPYSSANEFWTKADIDVQREAFLRGLSYRDGEGGLLTEEKFVTAGARELFYLHNGKYPDHEVYVEDRIYRGFEKDLKHLWQFVQGKSITLPQTNGLDRDGEVKVLRDALERLVHLHICEQEGLLSGKPTFAMWMEAVDKASAALSHPLPVSGDKVTNKNNIQ